MEVVVVVVSVAEVCVVVVESVLGAETPVRRVVDEPAPQGSFYLSWSSSARSRERERERERVS